MRSRLTIALIVMFVSGCARERFSRDQVIASARASLTEEARVAYPDVTEFRRQDWVHSWMVIFENKQRDDGVCVMIDYDGDFVTAGPAYARD
jgi:hypothetical protein